MFGSWFVTGYSPDEFHRWRLPWEGLIGLFLAPNSGLFVQSPFTALTVAGGWASWRGRSKHGFEQRGEVAADSHAPHTNTQDVPAFQGLLRTYSLCILAYVVLMAHWYDWQGGLSFASRMISEGYPLLLPLMMVGWNKVRARSWGLKLVTVACLCGVLYQLVGIAVFDAVTPLAPPHLPWRPGEHFYAVYVRHYGIAPAALAVAGTILQFVAVGCLAGIVLKRFILDSERSTVPRS
jgi:hypothetical protein